MNRESILKHTSDYREHLIARLQDPEFAEVYLDVALEDYEKDGDKEALLSALRNVVEAQGGVGTIARRSQKNENELIQVLSQNVEPQLDAIGDILQALGFRLTVRSLQA